MTILSRRGWRIGIVSLFFVAVLISGYLLRDIVNPLLVALLVAYILDPIVDGLERKGVPRSWSVVGIYVLGFLVVVIFGGLIVTAAISGIGNLSQAIAGEEGYVDKLYDKIAAVEWKGLLGEDLEKELIAAWDSSRDEAKANLGGMFKTVAGVLGDVAAGAVATLQGVFLIFSYLILVPVYVFFLLLSMDRIRKTVTDHLPGAYRERVLDVARKIDRSVSAFFRGRLIICLIKGILIAIGLSICGVRFAIPIGLAAGAATMVPFLGGIIATVPSIIIVLLEHSNPWGRMVGILAVVALSEGIEGFILTPGILSKETGLHPLTLLLSMFIAGEIFGFFGVLLAVPIASIVKILFAEFVLPEIRALAKEKPDPAPDSS